MGGTSVEPAAVGHGEIRAYQDHLAFIGWQPKGQHLAEEWPDLARRQIDNRAHLAADELIGPVMAGDLSGRCFLPDLVAKIDPELYRRLPGLRECLSIGDAAYPYVDFLEVGQGCDWSAGVGHGVA